MFWAAVRKIRQIGVTINWKFPLFRMLKAQAVLLLCDWGRYSPPGEHHVEMCPSLLCVQCSVNCSGGFKTRDVHCIDVREKRLLRPFHCQLLGYKSQFSISCNTEPCLQWRVEPWSEVLFFKRSFGNQQFPFR